MNGQTLSDKSIELLFELNDVPYDHIGAFSLLGKLVDLKGEESTFDDPPSQFIAWLHEWRRSKGYSQK